MRYTPKYFKDAMPEWKRKKDPPLSRIFYRPAGYVLATLFSNAGVSANTVSYLSIIEGIIACVLLLPDHYGCRVAGAVLVNLWLVLDCTDGCIARGVKAQPFGEFVDGISSYIIVALLGICMGMAVFSEGGLLIKPGCPWMILAGALASVSDTLMRLIYQKFKAEEAALAEKGIIERVSDRRTDHQEVGSLRVKIEQDFGRFEGINRFDEEYQKAKREYFARYPGGESFFDLAARVFPLIKELDGANALLVTHGGICRVIRNYFEDMGNEEFVQFSQENCEVRMYVNQAGTE